MPLLMSRAPVPAHYFFATPQHCEAQPLTEATPVPCPLPLYCLPPMILSQVLCSYSPSLFMFPQLIRACKSSRSTGQWSCHFCTLLSLYRTSLHWGSLVRSFINQQVSMCCLLGVRHFARSREWHTLMSKRIVERGTRPVPFPLRLLEAFVE